MNTSTDVLNALSAKEQLRLLLSQDKRKTERVDIPIFISYTEILRRGCSSSCDCGTQKPAASLAFSPKIKIDDISGGGLKFSDARNIKKHTVLHLRLYLSQDKLPLTIEGEVIWCVKIPGRNKQKFVYNKGVMFHRMNCQDRREFVSFLSDQILSSYLQNQTILQKKTSPTKPAQRRTK